MPEADESSEPSVTVGEILETFLGMPPDLQALIFGRAIREDPTVAAGALFPHLTDPERASGLVEVDRELRKDAVRNAVQLIRASNAKPVYPTELEFIAEKLREGSLAAPAPTVGELLYSGRVNAVYGTHTAGKTWTALYLSLLNAEAGGRTLFIDYEDSAEGLAARCMAMDPKLPSSVMYHGPSDVMTAASLAPVVELRGVTLVVIDSTGESMAASGYDSNSEKDVTAWFTDVPDGIAALGPAVLLLDHVAKKQDGTPMPVGSFRKSAAITGAQFSLENKAGFSRSQAGWSLLTCTKDRNGYFATGEVVGRVDFVPADGDMQVSLRRGEQVVRSAVDRMQQAILDYVRERMATVHGRLDDDGEAMDGRPNITQIRNNVKGDNTKIKEAVDRLVERGHLAQEHIKQGKTTRDVYVPGDGGFSMIADDDLI